MENSSKTLIEQVLELPASERIMVAEQLLISVDRPDAAIDKMWAEECESRLDAFECGEITTVPASQVLGKVRTSLILSSKHSVNC